MIKKIFSKVEPNKLLHIAYNFNYDSGRDDIAPPEKFLQVASIKPSKGKKFDAHYHLWKQPDFDKHIAQESWVVISGSIKVTYYDLDNSKLSEEIITAKGCSITFEGGHGYEILDDSTQIYEFKTGPYKGKELDKILIDE